MKVKAQDAVSNRWPTVRLGDVCKIILGGTPRTGIAEYWNGDIPWLTPGDMGKIRGLYVDTSSRKITQKGLAAGSTLFPPNSVILSTRAPIGYVFVNRVGMSTNQGCKTLVPNDTLLPEYLAYNLLGRNDELNALGTGTTFKELATGVLKSISIPLPPLAEQRKIVAKLEKDLARVEALRVQFERMATAADNVFKATLAELLSNVSANIVTLESICEPIKDGTHQTPIYSDEEHGVMFLSSKDVATGRIDWNHVKYIDPMLHTELHKRVAPRKGDILLAKNGTTGIAAIVDRDAVFDIYVTLALLRVRSSCNNKYLWYAVNSPIAKEQFNKRLKGMGVPNLHLVEIRQVKIPLPPLTEQREIVARLDAAKARSEGIAAKAREAVATCEKLRKAILAEAFQ